MEGETAVLVGAAVLSGLLFLAGWAFTAWSFRAERRSMSPEQYELFAAYTSAFGPAAPPNWQMLAATALYTIASFVAVWAMAMAMKGVQGGG